jgi:hypothetical protein
MRTEEFDLEFMKAKSSIPLSPFHCPIPLRRLSRPEFDELSRQIMAHAFASQNELGRLCDEAMHWLNLHHHEFKLVTIMR